MSDISKKRDPRPNSDASNVSMIGKRLKTARYKCGYSQQYAAAQLGITPSRLSQIESGCNFSVIYLAELCQLYSVSADFILFGKPPRVIASEVYTAEVRILALQVAKQAKDLAGKLV